MFHTKTENLVSTKSGCDMKRVKCQLRDVAEYDSSEASLQCCC